MEAAADAGSNNALERFFKFKQWNTSLKRDTLAGLTTFIVMSYIIFVNPSILGLEGKGLPFAAVLTSTCLVAGVMTLIMGLFTNRAYAIAPGMGLNAVVAFSLVLGQGLSFESAMGLIFLEGVAITILVLTGFREAIFKAIPLELKKAIVVGIGFFILFIGLADGGLVVGGGGTPLSLGTFVGVPVLVTIFGLVVTIIMFTRKWRGAVILGILFSTILAIILNYAYDKTSFMEGTAVIPSKIFAAPDFSLVGAFDFGAFAKLGVTAAILWIFSLMLSDFFDTMGTLVGVGGQAGYLDDKGDLPQVNRPLLVDSVPAIATAPALIIVGFLMMATLTKGEAEAEHDDHEPKAAINFSNLAFGIPAVLIMTIMPLTYSITNGIGFGFIAYTLIRVVQGRARDVSWMLWIASAGFIIYFLAPLFQAKGWV